MTNVSESLRQIPGTRVNLSEAEKKRFEGSVQYCGESYTPYIESVATHFRRVKVNTAMPEHKWVRNKIYGNGIYANNAPVLEKEAIVRDVIATRRRLD